MPGKEEREGRAV